MESRRRVEVWSLAVAVGLFAAGPLARSGPPPGAAADEGRGYLPQDLPLSSTPRRPWEDVEGPVSGPLVRRVRRVRRLHKGVERQGVAGFLTGKSIYVSPGHGWYWTGSSWTTQRGNSYGLVEDLSNAEAVDQFLVEYLMRAGAYVVPVREIDMTDALVICDNDDQGSQDCTFEEQGDSTLFSDSTLAGWGPISLPIMGQTNPFDLGTNRLLATDSEQTAQFLWVLNVPRSDYYNVYVSYSSYSMRAPDAHYVVRHAGGETHFRVDQRHHGGNWVLVGRFYFEAGKDEDLGAVVLANDSDSAAQGTQVSADAVRLGGGMGLIDRGGGSSGHPRYEECCRYHAQFGGAPSSVYDSSSGDDHTDDVSCRSRMAAWMHEDGEDAIYFSWHTNAGGGTGTSIFVYGPDGPGQCTNPTPTPGSQELADTILAEVVGDIRTDWDPAWTNRGRHCAWFGELNPSHNDEMPATLMELAFHDLPADVADLDEPAFRRLAARAVYQGMVKYFANRDGVPPKLLPEPPTSVAVTHTGPCSVEVSWAPPDPDPAGGDPPQTYLVYVSHGRRGFGDPIDTEGATSIPLEDLQPGVVYSVQVTAANEGGESLPTRILVVRPGGWPAAVPVLVVQGFGRLDASQLLVRHESSALGDVDRMIIARMNDGSYALRHAAGFALAQVAFDSCEDRALSRLSLDGYQVVDLVVGRGADIGVAIRREVRDALADFVSHGGTVLLSGSRFASEMAAGDAADQHFISDVLGLQVTAGAAEYQVAGAQWLEGMWALEDGTGSVGSYDSNAGDEIRPAAGGVTVADFSGSSRSAGVDSDVSGGRTVALAFPIEEVSDPQARSRLLADIAVYLEVPISGSDQCEGPDASIGDGGEEFDGGPDGATSDAATPCRHCPCGAGGCSCRSEPSTPDVWWLWLAFFALLVYTGAHVERRHGR
ncbi:MAG: fibronectin type III domain-containing protein [Deltaproteobacteria bacterium]|nr:fibronectin type III domain-containing protein [Deltaproteobacteria bacterium]